MMKRSALDNSAPLTSDFRQAVALLPSDPSTYEQNLQVLLSFVETYGHAIINRAQFGGKSVVMTEFSQSSYTHLKSQHGDLKSSALLNFLCSRSDQVLCDPSNPNWSSFQAFNTSKKSDSYSFVPFEPAVDPDMGYGGHAWSEQVEADPGIIDYDLGSVADLLTPGYFPADTTIAVKAQLLQRFIDNDFCAQVAGGCGTPPDRRGRWTVAPAAAPFAISSAAAVAVNDSESVFAVGGILGSFAEAPSLRWDSTAQTWRIFSPSSVLGTMIGPDRQGSAATLFGDEIVLTGGIHSQGNVDNTAAAFLPATREWRTMGSMTHGRYDHCIVSVGKQLLVFGGLVPVPKAAPNIVGQTELYDTGSQSWNDKSPMPAPRFGHTCTVHDGAVYIIGGFTSTASGATPAADVLRYDPIDDSWVASNLPPMAPSDIPRGYHATVLVGDVFMVLGGQTSLDSHSATASVSLLRLPAGDSEPAQWMTGCALSQPTTRLAAALLGNADGSSSVHVIGGCNGDCSPSTFVSMHVHFDIPDGHTSLSCGSQGGAVLSSPSSSSAASQRRSLRRRMHPQRTAPVLARRRNDAPGSSDILLGANYVGVGYQAALGVSSAHQIFDTSCTNVDGCFKAAKALRNQSVPDFMFATQRHKCSYSTASTVIKDSSDLQLSASALARAAGRGGLGILFDFAFSASADFSASAHALQQYQETIVKTSTTCISSEMHAEPYTGSSPPLTPQFVQAVVNLPATLNTSNPEPYLEFLREFGDSYVSGIEYGAHASQLFSMSQSSFTASLHAHMDISGKAAASFLVFFGKSTSEGASVDVSANAKFSQYVSSNHTECTPLCPPAEQGVATNVSSWLAQLDSLGRAPAIVYLEPITAVLNTTRFAFPSASEAHVTAVRTNVQKLLTDSTWCNSIPGCHVPVSTPSWSLGVPLPSPLFGASVSGAAMIFDTSSSRLFLTGGLDEAKGAATAQTAFHTVTSDLPPAAELDPWAVTVPMVTPRFNHSMAQVGSQVYVVGGQTAAGGAPIGSVEIFDLDTKTWATGPALAVTNATTTVKGGRALVLSDTLFVLGGVRGSAGACGALSLDVSSSASNASWVLHPHSLPEVCVARPGAAVVNATIFIFGGQRGDGSCSNALLHYDPTVDNWTRFGKLPVAMCEAHVVAISEQTAVVLSDGGNFLWSAVSNEFTLLPPSPTSVQGAVAAGDQTLGTLFVVSTEDRMIRTLQATPVSATQRQQRQLQLRQRAQKPHMTSHASTRASSPVRTKLSSPKVAAQQPKPRVVVERQRRSSGKDDAAQPFPWLDAFGTGYLPVYGDPLAPNMDPGFGTGSIFNTLNVTNWSGQSFDVPGDATSWQLPPGMNGRAASYDECRYHMSSKSVHDAWEYSKLSRGIHSFLPSTKWGWPKVFGYEFSLGETWTVLDSAKAHYDATLTVAVGWCKRYVLDVIPGQSPFEFTPQFLEDLAALPMAYDDSQPTRDAFFSFSKRYGLYAPSAISFGSLVSQVSLVQQAGLSNLIQAGDDISGAASANLLIFFGMAGDAAAHVTGTSATVIEASIVHNTTSCAPRCPPAGPDVDHNTTAWQSQLRMPEGQLAPVAVTWQPIVDLIYQNQHKLPAHLQGARLGSQLQALTYFASYGLCQMLPQCSQAQSSGHWAVPEEPAKVPTAVAHAVGLSLESSMFIIGGITGTDGTWASVTNLVQIYDEADPSQWVTRWPLQTARGLAAGAVYNQDLWVCGGIDGNGHYLASCEVSRNGAEAWSANFTLAVARAGHAMAVLGTGAQAQLFVFGGSNSSAILNSVEFFNVTIGRWMLAAPVLPQPTQFLAILPVAGAVLLFGGEGGSGPLNSVLSFDGRAFSGVRNTTTATTAVTLPFAMSRGHATMLSNTTVLLFGGSVEGTPSNTSLLFDTTSFTFSLAPSCPWKVTGSMLLESSQGIMLAGGYTAASAQPSPNITLLVPPFQ
eukprot:m.145345 g.145345  ORF g.145345 m.145345 type:complete len:1947 (+) comp10076_c0_seq3:1197-7037(+)